MVNGPENSGTLANSLKEVFEDVNDIQKTGSVTIDETRVDIELFLGGDYKVNNCGKFVSVPNSGYWRIEGINT